MGFPESRECPCGWLPSFSGKAILRECLPALPALARVGRLPSGRFIYLFPWKLLCSSCASSPQRSPAHALLRSAETQRRIGMLPLLLHNHLLKAKRTTSASQPLLLFRRRIRQAPSQQVIRRELRSKSSEEIRHGGNLCIFTYEDLKSATRNFRLHSLFGERIVQVYKLSLAEGNFLRQLHHPTLLKLIGYCSLDDQRLLVCKFMSTGSLQSHLF